MESTPATDLMQLSQDYVLIERAIAYLDSHAVEQPDLAAVANAVGLSEFHFQRLFSRWAGISPKRFLQFVTREHARRLLDDSDSMLAATYQLGLSSPGRLHDLFVTTEAVTPGRVQESGRWPDHPIWSVPHSVRQVPPRRNRPGHLPPWLRSDERGGCTGRTRFILAPG